MYAYVLGYKSHFVQISILNKLSVSKLPCEKVVSCLFRFNSNGSSQENQVSPDCT